MQKYMEKYISAYKLFGLIELSINRRVTQKEKG